LAHELQLNFYFLHFSFDVFVNGKVIGQMMRNEFLDSPK